MCWEDLSLLTFVCLFTLALGDITFDGSGGITAIFKQKSIQESGKVRPKSGNLTCTIDFSTVSTWHSTQHASTTWLPSTKLYPLETSILASQLQLEGSAHSKMICHPGGAQLPLTQITAKRTRLTWNPQADFRRHSCTLNKASLQYKSNSTSKKVDTMRR